MIEDERDAANIAALIELAKLPGWHDHAIDRARNIEREYRSDVAEGMFVGLSVRVLRAVHDAGVFIEPTSFHGTDYRPHTHRERAERSRARDEKELKSEERT